MYELYLQLQHCLFDFKSTVACSRGWVVTSRSARVRRWTSAECAAETGHPASSPSTTGRRLQYLSVPYLAVEVSKKSAIQGFTFTMFFVSAG